MGCSHLLGQREVVLVLAVVVGHFFVSGRLHVFCDLADQAVETHPCFDVLADFALIAAQAELLAASVAFLDLLQNGVDLLGRNRLRVLVGFLTEKDPLDDVLFRPVPQITLELRRIEPPGLAGFRRHLLEAPLEGLSLAGDLVVFDAFSVNHKRHTGFTAHCKRLRSLNRSTDPRSEPFAIPPPRIGKEL